MKTQIEKLKEYLKANPKKVFLGMFIILILSLAYSIYNIMNRTEQTAPPPLPSFSINSGKTPILEQLKEAYKLKEMLSDSTVLRDSVQLKKINENLDKLLKNEK
ncbi:MAG: hypothetical protein KGV44_08960 [Flavobacteriaceae bacterium]|nr:hypothetical protein [Flavobacteriaceae bacterium]